MISNKTLALLIVGTVVFSIVGQFISIYELSNLKLKQAPFVQQTGFASSQTGLVNLTIMSATDISIVNATVDFGRGVINSSRGAICTYATLTSNTTESWGNNLNNCWVNDTWSTEKPANSPVANQSSKIQIQNDGNVILSVTLTSLQRNWSNFIGNCSTEPHNWYQFTVNQNESTSCAPSAITSAWTNLTGGTQNACTSLSWQDANDSINIAFNVSICQSNLPTGYKNDNLTFTSAAA